MRFFSRSKDGGPSSTVTGYWMIELKSLFSIAILRFDDGSRDEFHSHAFGSANWVLKGDLVEQHLNGPREHHVPSIRPVITRRSTFHRVVSKGTTWVLAFRGPWAKTWKEYDPQTLQYSKLGHGRRVVG